jgi:hypothetical protein
VRDTLGLGTAGVVVSATTPAGVVVAVADALGVAVADESGVSPTPPTAGSVTWTPAPVDGLALAEGVALAEGLALGEGVDADAGPATAMTAAPRAPTKTTRIVDIRMPSPLQDRARAVAAPAGWSPGSTGHIPFAHSVTGQGTVPMTQTGYIVRVVSSGTVGCRFPDRHLFPNASAERRHELTVR